MNEVQVLDLYLVFTSLSQENLSRGLASVQVVCDALGLASRNVVFVAPLSEQEQEELRWYLEEYWKWPYEGFSQHGKAVEALLRDVGQRLYQAVFRDRDALRVLQEWQRYSSEHSLQPQISILCTLPHVLRLPWELLHNGQEFLLLRASQPFSLVRRYARDEEERFSALLVSPLHVLLITARPDDVPFVDPRTIARELLDAVQESEVVGTIELEFLRPPTWLALRERLQDTNRPVHVLHFDGHGTFGAEQQQGELAFENADGKLHLVTAAELAFVLSKSSVHLVVLTACKSGVGVAEDVFSSVAARLIESGVDAVVAMSAMVLVTSITRYVAAFYQALLPGQGVPSAHVQAQRALAADPQRHLQTRYGDEEGQFVFLQDWWVPHFYQRRPFSFVLAKPSTKAEIQDSGATILPRLSEQMPDEPRYGFSGRARELLQLERWLIQGRVVVVCGFGGIGKTAVVREAADWFTRTGMYAGACFVSFEHGGDASMLLSMLGSFLQIYDSSYHPYDIVGSLAQLRSVLKTRRVLVIADNLESILPGGEAPSEAEACTHLYDVLLELAQMGAGVLLTSRDTAFGDPRLVQGEAVKYRMLRGLHSEDAFLLATRLLERLHIERQRVPYILLRELLAQLDHHPLAIQLVLPVLHTLPLARIQEDLTTLLPQFTDDTVTGRNRSLSASLAYSLQRLNVQQQTYLSQLVLFEGGAIEGNLLAITEMPENVWQSLRQVLRRAALLMVERVHTKVGSPYLHFHPLLIPYLRSQFPLDDETICTRYIQYYHLFARVMYGEDASKPQQARASIRRELPNLRRALVLLLERNDLDSATDLAERIAKFLVVFGMERIYAALQQQIEQAISAQELHEDAALTHTQWVREMSRGEDELERGAVSVALQRFAALLERVEALPDGHVPSPGSYEHCLTVRGLARCLNADGRPDAAEARVQQALAMVGTLRQQFPDDRDYITLTGTLTAELGDIKVAQGQYERAKDAYDEALSIGNQQEDQQALAFQQARLGALALLQGDYAGALIFYQEALTRFHEQKEPAMEAACLHELGRLAEEQEDWPVAEHYYRDCLQIREQQLGDSSEVADTCNQLALVAQGTGRFDEAENWLKHALAVAERTTTERALYATLLNNLAGVLVDAVHQEDTPITRARLVDAQSYAAQALTIRETLDASEEIWKTLWLLASIAEIEGRMEDAQAYWRRERQTFTAFPGNQAMIDEAFGPLIDEIASAATGNSRAKKVVKGVLPQLEAEEAGQRLAAAIRRILKGERVWPVLVENLDRESALIVRRILDTIAEAETMGQTVKTRRRLAIFIHTPVMWGKRLFIRVLHLLKHSS